MVTYCAGPAALPTLDNQVATDVVFFSWELDVGLSRSGAASIGDNVAADGVGSEVHRPWLIGNHVAGHSVVGAAGARSWRDDGRGQAAAEGQGGTVANEDIAPHIDGPHAEGVQAGAGSQRHVPAYG